MRSALIIALCFFLSVSSQAFASNELIAKSHLKAVTVYTNRAMLTRQATVDVPAGAHTIVFNNLSISLLQDSLRAKGKAVADVKFGAVSSKIIHGDELVAPREKELNGQLEALQDNRRNIEAEKQALSFKKTFLNTLSNQGALRSKENIAEINLKPEQWAAAAQTVYVGMSDVLKSRITQDIALRVLNHRITKIRKELSQLKTGQRSTYQVMIPVEASAATKLTVDLSYQLPNATWKPLYDARLDTNKGTLELVQYGSVSQNSGEDWSGVALTLSTAQPHRGAELPDLQTMWVNSYHGRTKGVRRSRIMEKTKYAQNDAILSQFGDTAGSPEMEMSLGGMVGKTGTPVQREAKFTSAVIETGGFVSEYKIPGPSTVKADGTKSKLMIGTFDTDSEIRIQVKPQISSKAYLVPHLKLKGEAPILAGNVSLFRDGAFVGQSRLPLLRPGQESDLAFGIDDQISVRRRVLKNERSEAGIIARDNVQERHFVTELQNLHKEKVKIVVLETIPVPQNKQIGVEIVVGQTTPGYEKDKDNVKGLLRWELPLEPKQKSELRLGWKITWPKDQAISGL
ncbi:MAG: mucoidy inhibitor MuiA family protein [Alphaproteobacteria bacterium]|nr:mucoidy inhibitor MuiA family protein [Alphaproteobacteria bacterium]